MILAHDHPPIPGYDQDLWASRLRYHQAELDSALNQFTGLRMANLRLLTSTTPEERQRFGIERAKDADVREIVTRLETACEKTRVAGAAA